MNTTTYDHLTKPQLIKRLKNVEEQNTRLLKILNFKIERETFRDGLVGMMHGTTNGNK